MTSDTRDRITRLLEKFGPSRASDRVVGVFTVPTSGYPSVTFTSVSKDPEYDEFIELLKAQTSDLLADRARLEQIRQLAKDNIDCQECAMARSVLAILDEKQG
jgi:hypothetical protein